MDTSSTAGELHQLHSLQTAAMRLACSVRTLQRAIDLGAIKAVRIGRHWRISEGEVRRIVQSGLHLD